MDSTHSVARRIPKAVIVLATLPASLLFGLLWQRWGAAVAFTTGALLAATAALLLLMVRSKPEPSDALGASPPPVAT